MISEPVDVSEIPSIRPYADREVLIPSAPATPPHPLLIEDPSFVDSWLIGWHRKVSGQIHDLACYKIEDLKVVREGTLGLGNRRIADPEVSPVYLKAVPELELEPTLVVEEPCLVATSHGVRVYGHFLVEMLPRLLLAKRAGVLSNARLLLRSDAPGWLLRILLNHFGIQAEQIVSYRPTDTVLLRRAIVPTLAHLPMRGFHPACGDMLAEHFAEATRNLVPGLERIFITRALFDTTASWARRCTNELALAKIAKDHGFAVIAPESHSFETQVAMFASAKAICGESGSAMHTTLFAQSSARVGTIGALSLAQSFISALRGQQQAIMKAKSEGSFEVDEQAFKQLLRSLIT